MPFAPPCSAAKPKIQSDPRTDRTSVPMPRDGKRAIYGGFAILDGA